MDPTTLPGPLRHGARTPFVGRSVELAALLDLVPRLPDAGQRIALVGGEAGSGKSRLVRELAQHVAKEGVLVLHGSCDPVVHTPFRPFVEALEQLVRQTDEAALRAVLGPFAGELSRLVDLRPIVGELPQPVSADPDTERHRLHSAVAELLLRVGDRQPVLLVLEDCHWADTPTLLLLRHLAKASGSPRLLVLATFRDTSADVPDELADALADLRRSENAVRVNLGGLDEPDIAEFACRMSGDTVHRAEPRLVSSICSLTEGNAFLLCELWRTLVESGTVAVESDAVLLTRPLDEIATPESIREVVNQRAQRLEPATRDVLELAATLGSEFELEVLADASRTDADLPSALGAAVASGMLEELPSHAITYRFTHELVRRAIYDRLSALRRAELHLQIAETLERAAPQRASRTFASLAYHYTAAIPLGSVERAVTYNIAAASAAAESLDFDEAATRLSTAIGIGIDDRLTLAEVQLELGAAQYRAGATVESLAAFLQAAEVARELEDGELLARAAIGYENTCWRPGIRDSGAVSLLEEALAKLPDGDSSTRVRLLAGLAGALDALQGEHELAGACRSQAIEMARRIGDDSGLANVLVRAYWSDRPRVEILPMLAEAQELATTLGDVELEAHAREWRICTLMVIGDLDAASRELATVQDSARRTRQPFILYVAEQYSSALALLAGRLSVADAAAERSREWGSLLSGRDASGVYGIQMFGIRREQGRLGELAPIIQLLAADEGREQWRPGLIALLAELGMVDAARRELDALLATGLDRHRESLWLAAATYLTDACAAVGHEEMAEVLYPELLPLSSANVVIAHGVACYGAADRYLGMLAATLEEFDVATRHFEAAIELNRSMSANTWLAHSLYEFGRMLLRRGDRERASALLSESLGLAESIGMPTLLTSLRTLGASAALPERLPDSLSTRECDVLRLIARGLSNREIGAQLFISEHTAANHVRSILRKTRSANRTEAASYAVRQGLASG